MPVAEALACGAKVITSDIPELREAGGEEAFYIKATQEGIEHGILTVIEQAKQAIPIHRTSITWRESANILTKIFMDLSAK